MKRKKEMQAIITALVKKKPVTRKQLLAMYRPEFSEVTILGTVTAMLVAGEIFEGEKRNGGALLSDKPFVKLEQRIIDLLSEGDLSGIAITRKLGEHNSVVQARLLLLRDRRIIKPMGDAQNRTWRLIGQPDHEVMLMSDQEAQQLRQLVAAQWRGTPWQGMEAVL